MFSLPGIHYAFALPNAGLGIWMLFIAIILHGPAFDFFLVTCQVYVDQRAPEKIRGAAQGLYAFVAYGAGMLVGSVAQGFIIGHYTVNGVTNWRPTWIIPAVGAAVLFAAFAALFTDTRRQRVANPNELPLEPTPEGI